MLEIGTGKADITAFKRGQGMLGYGIATHIMLDIETPLFARAFVFFDPKTQKRVAIVNCELAMINPSLKDGVIEKLSSEHPDWKYNHANLLLTAQHTHCSPSGFSLHPLYSMSTPGFDIDNYNIIVNGIVSAMVEAESKKSPGKVQLGKSAFNPDVPISFNRSIGAYNLNPDIDRKLSFAERNLAVDKNMTLIQLMDENGKLKGAINWFAVHTTNLPNNFMKICSDNKGFAATELEQTLKEDNKEFIGAFAQGVCGDVSARVKYNGKLDRQRGYWEGVFEDDLKSSRHNGHLQYEKAKEIMDSISKDQDLSDGGLDGLLLNTDFSKIDIDPAFTNGKEGCVTSPSCMGSPFLVGSIMDGPGMPELLGVGANILNKIVRKIEYLFANGPDKAYLDRVARAQAHKAVILETGKNRIMGAKPKNLLLPDFADVLVRNIKHFDRIGVLDQSPLTPQILPLQLIRIGSIAILGIPFEITTIAGKRLMKTVEDRLSKQGIQHIILAPYANAYNGYIVTNEEYQLQMYEGGHCVFGQWSLNALQEKSAKLAEAMGVEESKRPNLEEAAPDKYTKAYMEAFAYSEGNYYKSIRKKEERRAARNKAAEERKSRNGKSY